MAEVMLFPRSGDVVHGILLLFTGITAVPHQ